MAFSNRWWKQIGDLINGIRTIDRPFKKWVRILPQKRKLRVLSQTKQLLDELMVEV